MNRKLQIMDQEIRIKNAEMTNKNQSLMLNH